MIRLLILICPFALLGQSSINIELLDNWTNDDLMVNSTHVRYNECWGFVQNNREYALLGSTEGLHVFEINANDKFEEIDFVPGLHQASTVIHRDFKVYGNYIYTVCDEGNSSLQIIDKSYLPDSVHIVNELTNNFVKAHNVFVDEENALLYVCGPHHTVGIYQFEVYSLADPINPTLVWTPPDPAAFPYVHDVFVRENIAYLSCGTSGLRVYDFTDPVNPVFIQNISIYQEQGYNHQGWMSPDGSKFLFADETNGKKIKNCVVNDDHTLTIQNYFGSNFENGSVPHNIMMSNDFAYVAYYNEGLRVYDLNTFVPTEIGHYDTYPEESLFKMEGAWGVYSDLPSGRIIISDRHNGLFLFDFNESVFKTPSDDDMLIYPNPTIDDQFTVKLNIPEVEQFSVAMMDVMGKLVYSKNVSGLSYTEIDTYQIRSGIYYAVLEYTDYLGDLQKIGKKVMIR